MWARDAVHGRVGTVKEALARSLESPGTRAYTNVELHRLFAGFSDVHITRWVTPYDRRVAGPLATLAGSRLGWFAGVTARR